MSAGWPFFQDPIFITGANHLTFFPLYVKNTYYMRVIFFLYHCSCTAREPITLSYHTCS